MRLPPGLFGNVNGIDSGGMTDCACAALTGILPLLHGVVLHPHIRRRSKGERMPEKRWLRSRDTCADVDRTDKLSDKGTPYGCLPEGRPWVDSALAVQM